jgi:hypothetical protein
VRTTPPATEKRVTYTSFARRAVRKLADDPGEFARFVGDRAVRNIRALRADPVETLVLAREQLADRDELRAKRVMGGGVMPWPPCPYDVDEDWEPRLHEALGTPWPCRDHGRFWELWEQVIGELQQAGLRIGRGAYAGWGDGEPGLVRAVWCLVRHARAERVVETGVARGITTRFVVEALEQNDRGHLWSVDLPPLREPELHAQTATAVPERLRRRWTYVRGSSRTQLPSLLARTGPIDLFIHDSAHTARNVLFELEHAWRSLAPEGVAVVDDVDLNCGFHAFMRDHAVDDALICHAEPLQPDRPRQDARGVFAIARRPRGGVH